ncbi:MAG: PAS domain S-box protein [Deltaproteobacteria bacterium]|nr:PAS domain S-box protein [Deltaproteobacteria bacterium]
MGEALQIVLQTTQESLNLWVESYKFQLSQLAEDPRLISLTERQLSVSRNKNALLKSDTLKELRDFFQYRKNQFGQAEFFIISPDFINIASMWDGNMGDRNLIANQALDRLNRAFQGEAVIVPPIWSDIPIIAAVDGKNKNATSMFFAAPIKSKRGNIIAAVAERVDPSRNFSRLIQLGRIGKSGETYAFGPYGKLLSESRFNADLLNTGLLGEGEKSILSVSVRDPGGDMTKGFSPSVPRYQQPLTLMAEQATKGKSGLNVEGYRDYRGVPVYGAWLWDDKLGVGLATEIDQADALGSYFTTRMVILTVLGITVLLALGSLVFAVSIDVRASRALQKSYDELELRVEERTAELKENQARLAQAEERSRLLLESAEEGIFGVAENGLVNFINPAGLDLLGFEADELIGQKIHPLIHHTRHDGTPYPIEECPMYHSLTQGVSGSRDDEVLWRKDGTSFPVEYTSVPIRKNGSIAGTVVIFRDISERKKIETALLAEREQLQKILDNSPVGVGISTDNVVRFANPRFTELFDRRVGQSAKDAYVNPDDRRQILAELERSGIVRDVELKTYGPGGKICDTLATFIRTEYEGRTGVLAWMVDLSGPKKAERELKERLDELARFRRMAIGREQKMIELKKEINELLKGTEHAEKYKIH